MRILFLTHRLPYAPNRGDRVRSYHLLRRLRDIAPVDLVSLVHDDEEASHKGDLQEMVATVQVVRVPRIRNLVRTAVAWPTWRPATHTMLNAPGLGSAIARTVAAHPPSVVFAYCSGVAHVALRPPLAQVPLVLDMVDVDSAKWAALASTTGPPRAWVYAREARVLARFEREITRRAATTLVTTEHERETLIGMVPTAHVEVMQNGVDVIRLQRPAMPGDTLTVVFCGVMDYPPNVEGALWLAREVWPLVRRSRSDARLQLVGSHPTEAIRCLGDVMAGIEVTGHVADVRPYLWNAAIAVAPLLTARGVQNKVLEAVAAGLPTVVTPVVMRGVPREVRPACLEAADANAFADAILRLLEQSSVERRRHAARADLNLLSWERRFARLDTVLTRAGDASTPGLPRRSA